MKKIISVLLSLCLLVTMVSMVAISASADTLSNLIYTFDDGSKPSDWTNKNKGDGRYTIEIVDLTDSEGEGDSAHGNVLKFGGYGDLTNVGFKVPADMMNVAGVPTKITFDVKAYNSSSTGALGKSDMPGFALRNSSGTSYYLPQPTNVTQSWQTMELDLSTQSALLDDYNLTNFVVRKCASGNKIVYIDNFTLWYDEYSANRQPQEAPPAPTVASATSTSVTLNAIADNCQYSKDGVTWQGSTTFTGLTANTEYTFYARYRETVDLFTSPASAGTVFTTPVVYKWNLYSDNFTLNNTSCGNFNTAHAGDGTYFEGTGLASGASATFTSKITIDPGVYSTAIYARAYNGRASINVDINGTRVANALNTSNLSGTTGTNMRFPLSEITITETSTFTITITTTSTGSLYLNSIEFTKTADYVSPDVDPYEDIAGTTSAEAQLRVGTVSGIRFITNVDADLIEAAKADGYTVTMGTLIAPLTYGELTLDSGAGNVPTNGYYYGISGKIAGSIANIKTKNIARDFVGRGYVTLTKDYGSKTYYSVQQTTGRSLKTLAAAAILDNNFYNALTDAQKNLVNYWANYTAE